MAFVMGFGRVFYVLVGVGKFHVCGGNNPTQS